MVYAWAKKGETERQVFLHFTKDLDAISIRTATAEEIAKKPERCFLPSTETGELWLAILDAKYPVCKSNVMLTGKEISEETGNAKAFPAEIMTGRLSKDKKSVVQTPYAFSVKQVLAMGEAPQNLALMSNNYGQPLLIVGQVPYAAKRKSNKTEKVEREEPKLGRERVATQPADQEPELAVARRRTR